MTGKDDYGSLDISDCKKLLGVFVKKKLPLFIHGATGIGKSYIVEEMARKEAEEAKLPFNDGPIKEGMYNFYVMMASQIESVDVRGVPFPIDGFTQFLPPSFLPRAGTKGLFFLDELNLAPPSVQAALYQLILSRKLGEYVLPDDWTIVAAGNRAEDTKNIFMMSPPLKNRFSHVEMNVPSEEQWRDWALDNNIAPSIVSFMAFKPSYLFKFNRDSKDNSFPTPRMWARASKLIEGVDDSDMEIRLIRSCVGEAAAIEYAGYMKLRNKVNINDILKHPEKVKQIDDLGIKYTLISGLADKYKGNNKLMDDVLAVVRYMDPEFGVFLLRLMRGMEPKKFVSQLTSSVNWGPISKTYMKYIM